MEETWHRYDSLQIQRWFWTSVLQPGKHGHILLLGSLSSYFIRSLNVIYKAYAH